MHPSTVAVEDPSEEAEERGEIVSRKRRREIVEQMLHAPPYVQDICALARAYGSCQQARETLSYQHMEELWRANNAAEILKTTNSSCSAEEHIQAILQACLLVVEHPELADPVNSRCKAVRAAGVYMTAITLASHPSDMYISVRLNSSTYSALSSITQPNTLHAVARLIIGGAERIANTAPRHGPAFAPVNPRATPIPRDSLFTELEQ